MDFTKAFNHIKHRLLYDKVENYGVRGQVLLLLKSYLSNRRQYVNSDNSSSSSKVFIMVSPKAVYRDPFYLTCILMRLLT